MISMSLPYSRAQWNTPLWDIPEDGYLNLAIMEATFALESTIALVAGDKYLDLHNCFDFVSYEYRPSEQIVRLQWNRGTGEWVSKELPTGVILTFFHVTNVAVHQRDDEMPFTEDSCLASISFLPSTMNDIFDAICIGERFPDEHLSMTFQSGAGIKIWAGKAEHEILSGESDETKA